MKKDIIIKGTVENPRNILIDTPHGLGDLIMCFPLFASIKHAHPDAKITALSPNKGSQLLLKHNHFIDEIFLLETEFTAKGLLSYIRKSIPVLRKKAKQEKYDLYIIIHPNIIRTINRRLGGIRNIIENTRNIHKTSECLAILEAMNIKPVLDYSIQFNPQETFLKALGIANKKYAVLDYYPQHLDKDPRKWDNFNELAIILKKHNIITVAVGINPAHTVCDADIDLVNKTTFDGLLLLIKKASACVTMDTGLFHLSYALNTPVLGLYGPIDPADRIPFDTMLDVHFIYKKLNCSPCIQNKVDIPCKRIDSPYLCMRSISANDVAERLLPMILSE